MININDVHQLVYNLAAKQQAAFPSPQNFNDYANLANMDLFNYYNDEKDKMLLRVKSGMSLFVPPVLAPFVLFNQSLSRTGNVLTQPADYIYDLALTSNPVSGTPVDFHKADYDKLSAYLNSTIDAPTNSAPIYVELADTFVVYPAAVPVVTLTYLKQPVTVKWGYTLVGGRPVYNPAGSTNFEFLSTEIYRLSVRILRYMGISIKDDILAQEAAQMEVQAS